MKALPILGAGFALLVGSNAASNITNSTAGSLLSSGNVHLGEYQESYEKAKAFVAQLSNSQKVSIITAGDVNGTNFTWTALTNKDAFAGMNNQYYVSGFPMGNALAQTWDRDHMYAEAKASGREFYLMGYNLVNGPVAGPLGRTPWGGRQPEAFSPDPYLSGIAMEHTIKGMNSAGVVTSGRHFLLNEQETNRSTATTTTTSTVYSSNADDKTLHELYLWPFADGTRAGMGAVMCGMTKVNGSLSCENGDLISTLLKEHLGFPGMVFPDVNSQSTSYLSANAGLDYGSSTYWTTEILEAGIANGSFTQARLDDMAIRNVIGYYFAGLDSGKEPSEASTTEYRNVRADHAMLIRKVGADSLSLLKNNKANGGGLPLDKPMVISIFGAHAGPCMAGPNQAFSVEGSSGDTYQGHLASAVGSGQLSFSYLATPYQALSLRAAADGSMFRWLMNDTYTSSSSSSSSSSTTPSTGSDGGATSTNGTAPGGTDSSTGNSSSSMTMGGGAPGGSSSTGGGVGNLGSGTSVTPSFADYATDSDVCLVFLNAFSGEGGDRGELANADQDAMVKTVAENCNNTIVIINTPGPRLVDQWIENDNVTAVVYGGILGQESGNAIVDVLYGDVNPSGKLISTIAKNENDYPVKICYTAECNFTEGVHIDYRYFDANNISVRYPFGHGLSYTTFDYGSASASKSDEKALASKYPTGDMTLGGYADLFDEVVRVSLSVKNTGSVDGSEVVQLYVAYPDAAQQPVRQLRGFEKVAIASGSSSKVVFSVRRRDISYWDVDAQQWAIASGDYTFSVGSSSRDLRSTATLAL
ncbi:hypothetical protein LTR85_000396 [Meristemomyces frigidus]|nr:hypothetical protein LTR85_000396 [Meristemomyces frigidus]